MFSIDAMEAGQERYYLEFVRDYYTERGEHPGEWLGAGAEATGLIGRVDADDFRALFLGFSPGGEKLVQNAGRMTGERARQPGWDVCWSAPKSVSVLWAVADETVRREVEAAQREAVAAGVHFLEEHALTRTGPGGKRLEPAALFVAAFAHHTSRDQDPQLHTHTLLLNVGLRANGTTGAILSEPFYGLQPAANRVYMETLAAELGRRLGVECVPEREWFEIKGVPQSLMRELSKRREAVESLMEARGVGGPAEAEKAALHTRPRKSYVPLEALFPRWREAARRHAFSPEMALGEGALGEAQERAAAPHPAFRPNSMPGPRQEDVGVGERPGPRPASTTHLPPLPSWGGEKANPFAHAPHLGHCSSGREGGELGERAAGRPAPSGAAEKEVRPALRGRFRWALGEVSPSAYLLARRAVGQAAEDLMRHESHFTEEALTRRTSERLAGRGGGERYRAGAVDRYLNDKAVYLGTDDRRGDLYSTQGNVKIEGRLLKHVARLDRRRSAVSTWLSVKAAEWVRPLVDGVTLGDDQKRALHYLTRTRGGIKLLEGERRSGRTTVVKAARDAWRLQGFTVLGAASNGNAAHKLERETGIQSRGVKSLLCALEKGHVALGRHTVLVVEGAGLVDAPALEKLLSAAQKKKAKVVLVGDARQEQPVGRGGALAAIAREVGGVRLTGCKARPESWQAERPGTLVEVAEKGLLTVRDTRERAMEALVADWRQATRRSPFMPEGQVQDVLIVAGERAEVRELNRLAQEARRKAGDLGKVSVKAGDVRLHRGDRVLFTRGKAAHNVRSGELGTVTLIEPLTRTVRVRLDRGGHVTLPLWVFRDVELGYAVTASYARSQTPRHAFVLAGGSSQDAPAAAVQLSCASRETRLYTDARSAQRLAYDSKRERPKEMAVDVRARLEEELRQGMRL